MLEADLADEEDGERLNALISLRISSGNSQLRTDWGVELRCPRVLEED
jgi:hypothetical protein